MNQSSLPQSRTLRMLWHAIFLVSFPFGILSFMLPIYDKDLGATALEVGGLFSAMSLGPLAGGWLYDNLGYATPFHLNAAVLLVGALLVAGVLREPTH